MSALTTIVVVGAIAWGVSRAVRSARTGAAAPPAAPSAFNAGWSAAPPAPPAWSGDTVAPPPSQQLRSNAPAARRPATAAGAAPRGLAAVTQAQVQAVSRQAGGPYHFSSQPQRRRPDRSARLFAQARGPGLCSPRGDR